MLNRRTKIVCTIGPASQNESTLKRLVQAGLNVARLNFSHGSYSDHEIVYNRLRKIAQDANRPITIMQDLQGPKIRTGEIVGGSAFLEPGQPLTLTTEAISGTVDKISIDLPSLPDIVNPGNKILLDDGNLELVVIDVNEKEIETRVVIGGQIKPHKGVNLPGVNLDIPGFTEKDEQDLAFGLSLGVDAVAISFVRSVMDLQQVRQAIARHAPDKVDTPVIAKLERPEALKNLEEIVENADGVMVARGDLGVEMSPEEVPIAQKKIIECANSHGKIVITATQMLDSMIHNPRPTRAEASDVANAILDGTDAVMLSGETATGEFPVQSVEMMNAIACQAEDNLEKWGHYAGVRMPQNSYDDTYYMTLAARELAHDRNVAAIAVFTKSGRTARMMSKARPGVPILGFTIDEKTYHRMAIFWGVSAFLVPHAETIEMMLKEVEAHIVEATPLQPGQQVVLICGFPVHEIRPTNLALLYTLGQ